MSSTKEKEAILLHAGFIVVEAKSGLIGSLHPFRGLDEADFAEIVEALLELHNHVILSEYIDKELIAALWWICDRSRILMLDPKSGIRQNNLATEIELELLSSWVDVIESIANGMLQNVEFPMCVYRFLAYISEGKYINSNNFIGTTGNIKKCIDYDDPDIVDAANRALAVIGSGDD